MQKHNTIDKHGLLRYDFLFSYWMFAWFALFWFLPKHSMLRTWLHPAFTLAVGAAENLVTFLLILIYNPKWNILWKFFAMMLCIKVAPLYLVMYETTPTVIPWKQSILAFMAVFSVYLGYLWFQDASLVEIYKTAIRSVVEDKNETPLYTAVQRISVGVL